MRWWAWEGSNFRPRAFWRIGDPQIPASFILDHPGLMIFADDSAVSGT
ncbi:hypothetical protein I603_1112 [Erythrobacter dokdonensis DSW-74]|uniref:Uncharacterized protein n=1 Tax=Erythrobacter dokdonensis DSW-74 TaxID=1300349 RepID=A0A1A7BGQ2_9SPHN|nr:hypothetical protein I603_1112 [Erythrobacter dokdonensis DSW-74]